MSRKAQPEISPIGIGLIILVALFDALFLLISPINAWLIIFAIWGGGPLIGNIINYYAARAIRRASKLNPFLLILFSVVFQVAVLSFGILLSKSAHGGMIMDCSDSCSATSFGEQLRSLLMVFQLFFIGAYIGLLSYGIKNERTKKRSTRRKAV